MEEGEKKYHIFSKFVPSGKGPFTTRGKGKVKKVFDLWPENIKLFPVALTNDFLYVHSPLRRNDVDSANTVRPRYEHIALSSVIACVSI